MTLASDFQFSQGTLQDFVDCRRRFQYRYLLQVAWPAVEIEPALENERRLQLGASFHQLVRQHLTGLPADRLTSLAARDEDLARWWTNYQAAAPAELEGRRHAEIGLAGLVGGFRLAARYDLVVIGPSGVATIFDWKTNQNLPRREWLHDRLQTRIYPYLLVQAGAHLNGGQPLDPDQVAMVYWFADHPDQPQRFPYSAAQYDEDGAYLAGLVAEIAGLGEDEFPLTEDERRCRFCVYRSLCDRGVRAGDLQTSEDELAFDAGQDLDFDFDQIAEIEY